MRFNNCDSRLVNWVFLVQHGWILCSVFADATTKITQWNPVRCSGYTPPWQNWRLTLVRRKTLIYRMCPHAGLSHQSLCCWAVLKIRAPACFHCAPDCLFMHLHAPHEIQRQTCRLTRGSDELPGASDSPLVQIHNVDIKNKNNYLMKVM